MLSCDCVSDSKWYYYPPNKFTVFDRKRRKRCSSCGFFIAQGMQCVEFEKYREAKTDIEERIYGSEIKGESWFLCEKCGEIYFNLDALGYCYFMGDNINENLKDYWKLTGFKLLN